ncbi:serine/threonine-protein phosphatase 2A 55 kDa regulatory subunit B beta isoform isoform X1 [Bubalus bubalis]|uniref:serine/threonine-protein phosphatase 2A 55 kDa regulatory subunit B beta isoform isoform X1 n=2 Tax=Bubalus bubalis TaxID=89462 RepID=UPI000DBC8BBC|nr:serine/threonine-protein phosphatase 2A 55 kDa regulatory subunit B beta isoform isoform X1 [Bubalus bubalis]XP_044803448.1 serine/threonine-protein phosphatase 2A 55 kDa regulatory subunit B beta isoform isoform X1 [Bubalus bubalis]XP_044803449.1 serine/threonine-protein phosphatase 2A 55 kDa regulatory subunit B beta isoform isoform X1 [Bubalus bubalis]
MLLSLPALHLQTSEHHPLFQLPHGRLGPWCSPTGSPAPLSCETGCGEGTWILVCRLLVPTQVSLLSMEEDIDTRKINNSFLRDHSYATEEHFRLASFSLPSSLLNWSKPPPSRTWTVVMTYQQDYLSPCLYPLSALSDIISTVEFNHTGELLATGDKGGRVVIFQREQESKNQVHRRGEYNVYSTFQSHEPEFDYLKSLEIEEKINKIRWLPQQNAAYFLLSTNDKTVKLWKVSERDKRPEGYNLKDEEGRLRDPATITTLRVPVLRPMDLMVEATPRRVFANAHTYHINSISVNSDYETYMSADDLRINLWNFEITNQSFNIVDIKPANMEELTEVITAAEFHPHHCNTFVYSSSKGTIRLCDMRASALCDRHTKFFEEPEDPSNRSFFSEIISSISDVKFSHSGRYIMTRDYLTVKVWDLNMENRPIETYQVHDYLRSKLCSLYENDCIFDKFECVWNGSDSVIMTGSYNNFFRMFDRNTKRDVTLEASRENSKPRAILKPRKVCVGGKRRKDEISVDSLDFSKKILHTAWHPSENIIAVAATNNLYIFQDKVN